MSEELCVIPRGMPPEFQRLYERALDERYTSAQAMWNDMREECAALQSPGLPTEEVAEHAAKMRSLMSELWPRFAEIRNNWEFYKMVDATHFPWLIDAVKIMGEFIGNALDQNEDSRYGKLRLPLAAAEIARLTQLLSAAPPLAAAQAKDTQP